jgi:serine/threonine protein kinase
VIHRDLKPENLVFDNKGYLRITDFGIANISGKENANNISGTAGYMAPEVLCCKEHTVVADYYSLGVILYEMAKTTRPYEGVDKKEIREKMLKKQAKLICNDGHVFSQAAVHFINKLIKRKPNNRLGFNGIDEIKRHLWFDGLDWEKLEEKCIESPIKIKSGNNFDLKDASMILEKVKGQVSGNVLETRFAGFSFNKNFVIPFRSRSL